MNSFKPLAANSKAYLRLIATMGVDQVYPSAEALPPDARKATGIPQRAMRPNHNKQDYVTEGGYDG